LSPRSLSPISKNAIVNKNPEVSDSRNIQDEEKKPDPKVTNEINRIEHYPQINYVDEDEVKKLELVRQQIELAEEQRKLKDMLLEQEKMLKEKQVNS
jgi:hypothetical protein